LLVNEVLSGGGGCCGDLAKGSLQGGRRLPVAGFPSVRELLASRFRIPHVPDHVSIAIPLKALPPKEPAKRDVSTSSSRKDAINPSSLFVITLQGWSIMTSITNPVLLYPRFFLITGVACLLFFGACMLSSIFHPETISGCSCSPATTGEMIFVVGLLAAFATLGAVLVAFCLLERHELSQDNIASRNVFGRWRIIEWRNIKSVKYCAYPKAWFRLEARSGSIIRISFGLRGLSALGQLLLEGATNAEMDSTTRDVLRALALGHNPPLRLA